MTAMPAWSVSRSPTSLAIRGELRVADAAHIWRAVRAQSEHAGAHLDLDLSGANAIDGAVVALLVEVRAELAARGVDAQIVGGSDAVRAIVHLYRYDGHARRPPPRRARLIARLGNAIAAGGGSVRRLVGFAGELAAVAVDVVRRPATGTARAIASLVERAGTDGIPIVLVLNFLVGFVDGVPVDAPARDLRREPLRRPTSSGSR